MNQGFEFYLHLPFIFKSVRGIESMRFSQNRRVGNCRSADDRNRRKAEIQNSIQHRIPDDWDIEGKFKLNITFPEFVLSTAPTGDLDNVLGSIMDAGTGLLYRDDSQVWDVSIRRIAGFGDRAFIRIEKL